MKTLLVTGASGFIGSFAIEPLSRKYTVRTCSLQRTRPEEVDLAGIDTILYLAGKAHMMTPAPDEVYFTANHVQPLQLAKLAKAAGVVHFVYVSSVKVYGDESSIVLDENSICVPTDAYGKSKFAAEQDLAKLASPEFKVASVRPPLVYGPHQKGNLERLEGLLRRLPIVPFGGLNNERSMVYVGNLVALFERIIDTQAEGVFIGGDRGYTSTTRLVDTMITALGLKTKNAAIPKFVWNLLAKVRPELHYRLASNYRISNAVTNRRLVFTPPYSFEEGMTASLAPAKSES